MRPPSDHLEITPGHGPNIAEFRPRRPYMLQNDPIPLLTDEMRTAAVAIGYSRGFREEPGFETRKYGHSTKMTNNPNAANMLSNLPQLPPRLTQRPPQGINAQKQPDFLDEVAALRMFEALPSMVGIALMDFSAAEHTSHDALISIREAVFVKIEQIERITTLESLAAEMESLATMALAFRALVETWNDRKGDPNWKPA